MVKKFLSMIAISSMVFATSCSNEDFDSPVTEGESLVNFAVEVPNGLNSRAYGDGTTATKLKYSVYEITSTGWQHRAQLDSTATFSLRTQVPIRLVNGKSYKIVFWASAEGAPYTFNAEAKTVTVDYEHTATNDEKLDAFYAVEEITVNGSSSNTVELHRPFAQLNIGTADLAAYAAAGYSVDSTSVTVSAVYDTFDFVSENVAGTPEAKTFLTGARSTTETYPVSGYDYLAMNYLLVNKDKQIVDVTLNYGGAVNPTYANVPVQRNYRTNIYGNLLTSQEDFTVVIVPGFDTPDYGVSVWDGTTTESLNFDANVCHITSAGQLAQLMKETKNANSLYLGKTFILDTDISFANQTITGIGSENGNIEFTFDGNNHIISDFKIESASDTYAGLFQQFNGTVKNLTVKNATVKGNKMVGIIASNVDGGTIDKCTVEDCTVIAAIKKAGAITGYTSNGSVTNCVAKDVDVYCADADEAESGEIVGYINSGSTVNNNTATNVNVYRNIGVTTVSSAAELLTLGDTPLNNTTIDIYNKYIILANDINCEGIDLKPLRLIGKCTFDGAGHKLTNATTGIYSGNMSSLFSGALPGFTAPKDVTIKNLVIDNVVSASTKYAAVLYADIQDGLNITIDNVHIYNAQVKDAETVGGFVGFLASSGATSLAIKNSSVNNTTIIGTDEAGKIGAFVGRAQMPHTYNNVVANNVTCYNNTTPLTTVAEGAESAHTCTTGYSIR